MKKISFLFCFIAFLCIANSLWPETWKKSRPRFKDYVTYSGGMETTVKMNETELNAVAKVLKSTELHYFVNKDDYYVAVSHDGKSRFLIAYDKKEKFKARILINRKNGKLTVLEGVDYESFSKKSDAQQTAIIAKEMLDAYLPRMKGDTKTEEKEPHVEPPVNKTPATAPGTNQTASPVSRSTLHSQLPPVRELVNHANGVRTSVFLSSGELEEISRRLEKTDLSYFVRKNTAHWMAVARSPEKDFHLLLYDKTHRFNINAIIDKKTGRVSVLHGVDYRGLNSTQDAELTAKTGLKYLQLALKSPDTLFDQQTKLTERDDALDEGEKAETVTVTAKTKETAPATMEKKSGNKPAMEKTAVVTNVVWVTNRVIEPVSADMTEPSVGSNEAPGGIEDWAQYEEMQREEKLVPPRRKAKLPVEIAMEVWDYLSQFPKKDNFYHTLPEVVLERGDMDSDDFALFAWVKFQKANIECKVLVVDFEEGREYHTVCVFRTSRGWQLVEQEKGILNKELYEWKDLPGALYRRTVRFQVIDIENTWLKGESPPLEDQNWMVSVYFENN